MSTLTDDLTVADLHEAHDRVALRMAAADDLDEQRHVEVAVPRSILGHRSEQPIGVAQTAGCRQETYHSVQPFGHDLTVDGEPDIGALKETSV